MAISYALSLRLVFVIVSFRKIEYWFLGVVNKAA